ncbi:MAG: FHA domain-containing protein [Anaerolineaceae bacterium]
MAGFQLVMRSGPTPGKVYPLKNDEMFIGRDVGNDIVINDTEVSRRHSRLSMQAGGYIIEDLGSTNGTAVNGDRLTSRHVLRVGEVVSFGEHVALVFEAVADDKEATVAGPRTARKISSESGQAEPAPVRASTPPQTAPATSSKKSSNWVIILLIVLAILCFCVAIPVIIDYLNLWCSIPGINSLLGCS